VARKLNPRLVAFWLERISRQAASGLTIVDFCAQEGCARSAFQRWKRHFQRINVSDSNAPPTLPTPDLRRTPPAPQTFLPVAVRIFGNNSEGPPPVEADLPNGIRLRIPTGNARLACRLVRSIAAARTDSGGSK
jgi:hypothetical protein